MARQLPWRTVGLLAVASFFGDVSGEMLMAVLPFALLSQGATGIGLGLVGGLSDAVGHVFKGIVGKLADRTNRRMPWIMSGYVTAASARFGIAFANVWGWSLAFRSLDRVGKGLRTAPRDALLAEAVAKKDRGRAFGLHRASDTAGAAVGVLLALSATLWLDLGPTPIIIAAGILGFITLVPLAFVKEKPRQRLEKGEDGGEPPSPLFPLFLGVVALFSLGNLSYLFYMVRAADITGSASVAIGLYLLFNVVYMIGAYPLGRLADLRGQPQVLLAGYVLFAGAAAIVAWTHSGAAMALAFAVLGIGFAAVEGTGRALAADLAGKRARSSGLGTYHAITGLATVVGGVAAGLVWDHFGPAYAFWVGVGAPLAAAGALALFLAAARGKPKSDTFDL